MVRILRTRVHSRGDSPGIRSYLLMDDWGFGAQASEFSEGEWKWNNLLRILVEASIDLFRCP